MRSSRLVLGAAAVAATLAGCSSANPPSQPSLVVQGTVTQALSVSNPRAVAVGTDGRTFWTDLDAQRDFTLLLPVGQSYRIVIANGRGSVDEKVAHLVVQASWGSSIWLGANQTGIVDLGVLKLTTHQHGHGGGDDDDDDHEGDHDHDNDCHEGGHHGGDAGGGDGVCSGDQDEPLQPTKNPGSQCDDHDHHGQHHDGGKADCGKDHDGDGDGDGDGDDHPCPPPDAGPPKDAGGPGTDSGGGGGVGADCLTDADCTPPLTCKAGLCSP
jgi:hypothetical protein